jgi:hypothetical protein
MYVYTTKAVLEFASTNETFKTQTKHEFETSLYFFEKIYNTSCFLSIENLQTSKLLLNIALIFGKYPGMQIRSFNKAMEFLISGINESSLQNFFSYLFIRYENPKIITSNLISLSLIEVEILMHVLQGKNIKSNPNIPLPISKMESFHLINNVPKIEFKNDVIKRSIIASKLIKKSKNPILLERFLSCNDSFENQIDLLISCFSDSQTNIATLIKQIHSSDDLFNVNKPKVILNKDREAIYFSRTPLPYLRGVEESQWLNHFAYYNHIGIYAYKMGVLEQITALPTSSLEIAESLEQLRWIENGFKIKTQVTDIESVSIDTPEDLKKLKKE